MRTRYNVSYSFIEFETHGLVEYRATNNPKCATGAKCTPALAEFIGRNNEVILKELGEKL